MPMRHQRPRPLLYSVIFFFLCIPAAHAQLEILKNIYEQAVNAYNEQKYDQAIALYQKIVKVAPRQFDVVRIGVVALQEDT